MDDEGEHRGKVALFGASVYWVRITKDLVLQGVGFPKSNFENQVQIKLLLQCSMWRTVIEKWKQNEVHNQKSLEQGATTWVGSNNSADACYIF